MRFTIKLRDYITYQDELYSAEFDDRHLMPVFDAIEYLKRNTGEIIKIDFLEIDDLLHRTNKFNSINHEAKYMFAHESYRNVLFALCTMLEDRGFSAIIEDHSIKIIYTQDYVLQNIYLKESE